MTSRTWKSSIHTALDQESAGSFGDAFLSYSLALSLGADSLLRTSSTASDRSKTIALLRQCLDRMEALSPSLSTTFPIDEHAFPCLTAKNLGISPSPPPMPSPSAPAIPVPPPSTSPPSSSMHPRFSASSIQCTEARTVGLASSNIFITPADSSRPAGAGVGAGAAPKDTSSRKSEHLSDSLAPLLVPESRPLWMLRRSVEEQHIDAMKRELSNPPSPLPANSTPAADAVHAECPGSASLDNGKEKENQKKKKRVRKNKTSTDDLSSLQQRLLAFKLSCKRAIIAVGGNEWEYFINSNLDYSKLSTTAEMRKRDSEEWRTNVVRPEYWFSVLSSPAHPFGRVLVALRERMRSIDDKCRSGPIEPVDWAADIRSFVSHYEKHVRATSHLPVACTADLRQVLEDVVFSMVDQDIAGLYKDTEVEIDDRLLEDRYVLISHGHPKEFGVRRRYWLNSDGEVFEHSSSNDAGAEDNQEIDSMHESESQSSVDYSELADFEHSLENEDARDQSVESYASAMEVLRQFSTIKTPMKKLQKLGDLQDEIVNCVRQFHAQSARQLRLEADDMVSINSYLLSVAQPHRLFTDLRIILDFVTDDVMTGSLGYALATVETAAACLLNTQRDHEALASDLHGLVS
eukprot:ANDGO_05862.mRNA.1 hypothetical protein